MEITDSILNITDGQSIFDQSANTLTKTSLLQKILASRSAPQHLQQTQINQCQKDLFKLLEQNNANEYSYSHLFDSECLTIIVALYKPAFNGHVTPEDSYELMLFLEKIGFKISLMWLKKHLITHAMLKDAKDKGLVTS